MVASVHVQDHFCDHERVVIDPDFDIRKSLKPLGALISNCKNKSLTSTKHSLNIEISVLCQGFDEWFYYFIGFISSVERFK